MKRLSLLLLPLCASLCSCTGQETMEALTDRVFDRAAEQLVLLDKNLEEGECPRYADADGKLVTSDIWWWCSGFYPGSLWLVYEYTGNEDIRALAEKHTVILDTLQFRTNDHDVGFQLNCSYGNALRLTGNQNYVGVLCNGARSLATRFNPAVGCTRSWDPAPDHIAAWKFPVIIDNMMNLELLLKGAELSEEDSLRQVAESHAMTTMKNHYRSDGSCFHLVDYDPETGAVLRQQTVQGFADWSAWARGQAWGLILHRRRRLLTTSSRVCLRTECLTGISIRISSRMTCGMYRQGPLWQVHSYGSVHMLRRRRRQDISEQRKGLSGLSLRMSILRSQGSSAASC